MKEKIKPEVVFSIIIFIFGSILVFITPFGAGFDEDTHLGRIWEMSKGVIIPNKLLGQGPNYPYAFYEISYRSDVNLNPVSSEQWKKQLNIKISWDNMINHSSRASYFPTNYLMQAIIMGITGRLFDFPVGIIYYLLRFSYLFTYVILVYFAIRIIPFGKWTLGILSVLPMSLIQASIISIDGINNGLCFLFVGWILYLNTSDKKSNYSKKDLLVTAILAFFISTLKINTLPILLLLFFIPKTLFHSKKEQIIFITSIACIVLIVSFGWTILNFQPLEGDVNINQGSVLGQLQSLLTKPSHFLTSMLFTIISKSGAYFKEWVGMCGYWELPSIVYIISPVLIGISVFCEPSSNVLEKKKRVWLGIISLIMYLLTILIFYLLFGNQESQEIQGIQGRYFIAVIPLMVFALIPKRPLKSIGRFWIILGILVLTVITISSLFLLYHVTCGSSYFSFDRCYLPEYWNWDPNISLEIPITTDVDITEKFTSICDNIDQVRIWILKNENNQNGAIFIQLKDFRTNDVISSRQFSHQDLPSTGWMVFSFDPVENSLNRDFLIHITNPVSGEQGLSIAYYEKDEYPEGMLSIDNAVYEGDLLFQYGCKIGLISLLDK